LTRRRSAGGHVWYPQWRARSDEPSCHELPRPFLHSVAHSLTRMTFMH
jgi:hypothetical protein